MAIPQREQNLLYSRSGGRCAFCRRPLIADGSSHGGPVILGEMAHIVAERPNGPRGNSPLTPEQRNSYENLVLLCNIHHQLIDDVPRTYPVEKLLQMKQDHEAWVSKTLNRASLAEATLPPAPLVRETLHSTLLPVERMPLVVYGAPCDLRTEQEVKQRLHPPPQGEMAPFILVEGKLLAFQDLREASGPFRDVVDLAACERHAARSWWDDPDQMKWFVHLLNRTLNKLTGRRSLNFDKRHRRYFFHPQAAEEELSVEYRPLNMDKATRSVVWQPKNRMTGEGRGYWYHRAVALRFHRLGLEEWCLSIRPELHVTTDGLQALPSEKIGSRVTHKKSRMFNYDLLGEVQFWRDYLSNSSPRIVARFGHQSLVINTMLAHGAVTWPGVPPEHAMPFKNIEYLDDLFSWAELAELESDYDDAWEVEQDWTEEPGAYGIVSDDEEQGDGLP
jgi:hypothetical protein